MANNEQQEKARKRRRKVIALIVGMVLALACKSLPPDYQVVCDAIVSVCTLGG